MSIAEKTQMRILFRKNDEVNSRFTDLNRSILSYATTGEFAHLKDSIIKIFNPLLEHYLALKCNSLYRYTVACDMSPTNKIISG